MQIRSVGIDLGKTTFHLVALGDNGKVLLKKKFTQKQLITFTANMQTSLIGMEACGGAHFLGRALREQGHDVKLIPAQGIELVFPVAARALPRSLFLRATKRLAGPYPDPSDISITSL